MLITVIVIFVLSIFGGEDLIEKNATDTIADPFAMPVLVSRTYSIGAYPSGTHASAWFDASVIPSTDIQDPVFDLDPAILACPSLTDWQYQAARYPKLLQGRDPVVVLSKRCKSGPSSAFICRWLAINPDAVLPDPKVGS